MVYIIMEHFIEDYTPVEVYSRRGVAETRAKALTEAAPAPYYTYYVTPLHIDTPKGMDEYNREWN